MVNWVSTGNLWAGLCFPVTSEEICNLCQLVWKLKGENGKPLSVKCSEIILSFILTEESDWLVIVGGRTLDWSYWPRSGFYKTMRTGQGWSWQLSWWQKHSFDSYPTLHLTARRDLDVGQGSYEWLPIRYGGGHDVLLHRKRLVILFIWWCIVSLPLG